MSIYGDRAYAAFFKGTTLANGGGGLCRGNGHDRKAGPANFRRFRRRVWTYAGGLRCVLRYHTGAGGTLRQRRPAKKTALYTDVQALAAEYKARNGREA